MQEHQQREATIGLLCGVSTYLLFGLSPLFWKLLVALPAGEILVYRIVWALILILMIMAIQGRLGNLLELFKDSRKRNFTLLSALMIGINWFVFIYAVLTDQVLHISFGYFITPLVNIILGRIFFKELLNNAQKFSVALATVAVLYMGWQNGGVPYVSLGVGVSFGFYGLFRKMSQVPARAGLAAEMTLLTPLAIIYLFYLTAQSGTEAVILAADGPTHLLILGSGVITIAPLLLFAGAVKRVALTTIGFLQYIGPSCNFFLGAFVFHEELSRSRLVAFIFIWISLIIYTIQGIRQAKVRK